VRTENLPALADHHARIACPLCGSVQERQMKDRLNQGGRWLADGERIEGGEVVGDAQRSSIAGYWLGGVAAAYQSWPSLILRYLQGLREYDLTGSEETLQTTINTDQGMPFLPRALMSNSQNRPGDRTEPLARYLVPDEARFLIATVDVQGGKGSRFVCEVKAYGPGIESWVLDRFAITESPRGTPEQTVQIDPAGYAEDWDAITAKLVNATYRTSGERELRVRLTVVDTGGEAGATANAYAWYRRMKAAGLGSRVLLVKGASEKPLSPVTKATARDARGQAIKDVDLYLVDTNFFKDVVAANLKRDVPGPGYMHFPDWLPASYFEELTAERRDEKGKWHKLRARNEALDLSVYGLAGVWAMNAHRIDWANPPGWAKPVEQNTDSMDPEVRRQMKEQRTQARVAPQRGGFQPGGRRIW
jgi:phage terminase large subunit GpA-like protein